MKKDLFKIEELEPRLELAEWSGQSEQNGTCNGNDNSANGSCGTTNDSCGAAPKKQNNNKQGVILYPLYFSLSNFIYNTTNNYEKKRSIQN